MPSRRPRNESTSKSASVAGPSNLRHPAPAACLLNCWGVFNPQTHVRSPRRVIPKHFTFTMSSFNGRRGELPASFRAPPMHTPGRRSHGFPAISDSDKPGRIAADDDEEKNRPFERAAAAVFELFCE